MLTLVLKKEWFDKIKSGEKTHEYREVKDFWSDRFVKEFFNIDKKTKPFTFETLKRKMLEILQYTKESYNRPFICFMNGMYSEEKRPRLYAKMKSISIKYGQTTDLGIDKPVYDIEFELVDKESINGI